MNIEVMSSEGNSREKMRLTFQEGIVSIRKRGYRIKNKIVKAERERMGMREVKLWESRVVGSQIWARTPMNRKIS